MGGEIKLDDNYIGAEQSSYEVLVTILYSKNNVGRILMFYASMGLTYHWYLLDNSFVCTLNEVFIRVRNVHTHFGGQNCIQGRKFVTVLVIKFILHFKCMHVHA